MRAVILHMIQREPTSRLSAKDYLTSWGPSLFPEYFTSFLQPFCHTLLPLSADLRLAAVQQAFPQMLHFMAPGTGATPKEGLGGVSPLDSQGKSLPLSAEPSQAESVGRGAVGLGSDSGDGSASQSTSAAATRPSSASRGYKSGGHPHIHHTPCAMWILQINEGIQCIILVALQWYVSPQNGSNLTRASSASVLKVCCI